MKFYRYEVDIRSNGYLDEYDNFICSSYDDVTLNLIEYKLVKETPKGYWICEEWDNNLDPLNKKWISKTSRKRHAYPTVDEALKSFVIRKKKQIGYLKKNLTNVEKALKLAENEQTKKA